MRAFGNVGVSHRGFRPLGAAATPTAPPEDYTKYTSAAAPLVAALVGDSDSTESVETLKAKIKNHIHLRNTFPEPLKTLYANKVLVLKGKLKAALARQKRDLEDRGSKKEWAVLGKAGIVTGIVVGGALILLIAAGARKVGR